MTSEQAQILKLVGEQLAIFKVRLVGRWQEDGGWADVEGPAPEDEEGNDESEGDEAMSQ